MFVDASAMMAILKPESDGRELSETLAACGAAITSPIAILETVMSLGQQKGVPPHVAYAEVRDFLRRAGVAVRAVDERTGELAVDANAAFGKWSGHPARLNLGDCFAYAMAKQHGVPLLYKGDDFAHTDLA
jgi:ribonuclease VapC